MTDSDRSLEAILERVTGPDEEVVEFGRYQLLRLIGRGGMGQVFEAWDTQLERRVAIKVLTAEHSDDLALREARCVARVAHPNVISVHEVGCVDSLVFIAMELVDGPDLRQWLREQPRRWSDVLDQVIAAGRGLAAVHHAGLVHGDVKPGNLVVGRVDGGEARARIADFGLARARSRVADPSLVAVVRRAAAAVETGLVDGGRPSWSRDTSEACERELAQPLAAPFVGLVPESWGRSSARSPAPAVCPPVGGTKPYMAPECLAGSPEGLMRADQYSLCATAWEALFGVRPYAGKSAEAILGSIAADRLERGRGRPPGMPRALEAALLRGLSVVPERRWPSVDALVDALERAREAPRRTALRGVVGGLVAAAVGLGLAGSSIGVGYAPDRAHESGQRDVCAARSDALGDSWGSSQRAAIDRNHRLASSLFDRWVVEWAGIRQVRLLVERGQHQDAELALRRALAEAERLGLDQLRFELLIERVRIGQANGELRHDDLAVLDSLALRLDVDPEARVELASTCARASPGCR